MGVEVVKDYGAMAREFTPRGYRAFYGLVHNKVTPGYVMGWLDKFFEAREKGKGLMCTAFRGSTKTTTFATLAAWLHGLNPEGKGLIIRASDPAATETVEMMAAFIESNSGWKAAFPEVVPDTSAGWSQAGYCVKLREEIMPYSEWSRIVSSRQDPSFAGFGYGTKAIHGFHPNLYLWMDDLMDEENTTSDREMARLKKIYSGTLLPTTLAHKPVKILSGVPWTGEDVIAAAGATGEYIMAETWVWKDKAGRLPQWPEMFSANDIDAIERNDITGGLEFARNFLGDLTAAERRVFSYHTFPAHLIKAEWPMVGGVDYAGVADPSNRTADQSHFALAYVAKMPGGGAVVFDGVLEQCTQAESEQYVRNAQDMFPDYITSVVEGDGKGEEFYQVLYRHPDLRLTPMKTGGKGKPERLVRQMGPWLRSGRVRISDAETKFLSALRHFLNAYPNVSQHDPGYDAADALYWALRGMPDVLVMPKPEEELPSFFREKKQTSNPWADLGSQTL